MDSPSSSLRRDALLGLGVALALATAWTWRGWSDLRALRLPDTDDVMRLQQIRDWLGGQAWNDLVQHRLGIEGAGTALHWTRLADLVPGGLILLLAPIIGRHAAEVAAVIAWPTMLFAAALVLVARIARTLGGERIAGTAAIVAAIAYPATTIFAPGRIDHHGLQAVLLLGALLATIAPPREGAGFAAGLLAAASLVVGLETMPLVAVLGVVAVAEWVATGQRDRLLGLGIGGLTGLAIGRGLFAPAAWAYPACDGFTALSWQAAIPLAAMPLALAGVSRWTVTLRHRVLVASGVAGVAVDGALWLSPACLHPYGAVDPLLARLWLAHVGEARPLFRVGAATAFGYAGVMVAGLVATAWRVRAEPSRGWATLLALLLASLALTLVQVRGAYTGALIAAPGLAAAIAAARARGLLPLAGAWAASAGMLYPIAADALTTRDPVSAGGGDCASPALLARLVALPPGRAMAPIDAGAWIVAVTPQHAIAAPYHRDGAGNLAAYRLYLGTPAGAAGMAARLHVRYLVACAAMPGRGTPGTAATWLAARSLPGWHPVAALPDGARLDSPR